MFASYSFLVSVYNESAQYLDLAIRSMLSQSTRPQKIVIVNDGSDKRETLQVLDSFKNHPKICIINQQNIGLTKSLNIGASRIESRWIARHDSDDWSEHPRIELQLKEISDKKLELCGTQAKIVTENGKYISQTKLPNDSTSIRKKILSGNPFCHGSLVFSSDVFQKLGGYPEIFSCSQDYALFSKMSLQFKCGNLKSALYNLRKKLSSVSIRYNVEQIVMNIVIQEYLMNPTVEISRENVENRITQLENCDHMRLLGQIKLMNNNLLARKEYKHIRKVIPLIIKYPNNIKLITNLIRAHIYYLFPYISHKLFS